MRKISKKMPATLQTLLRHEQRVKSAMRQKLRDELRLMEDEHARHVKRWGKCDPGCQDGNRMLGEIQGLQKAIIALGGRVPGFMESVYS